jgi:hypothetical protein
MTVFTFEEGFPGWTFSIVAGRPKLSLEHNPAVSIGGPSLHMTGTHQCYRAYAWRQMAVPVGTRVAASIKGKSWTSSNPNAFPSQHDSNVLADAMVGVDLSGGDNPESSGVVHQWVGLTGPQDWKSATVTGVAQWNTITVFIGVDIGGTRNGSAQWPIAALHGWLAELTVDVETGAPQPPPPTEPPPSVKRWTIRVPAFDVVVEAQ